MKTAIGAWLVPLSIVVGVGPFWDQNVGGGGSGSFDGDLAGGILTDATDSEVTVDPNLPFCWSNSTCLDGSEDGVLEIKDYAKANGGASEVCVGDKDLGAGSCFVSANFNTLLADGTGAPDSVRMYGAQFRSTATGDDQVVINLDQIELQEAHVNGGVLCWGSDSTSTGTNVCLGGVDSGATEAYVAAFDSASAGAGPGTATFKMGDPSTGSGMPTCDNGTLGLIPMQNQQANDGEHLMSCIRDVGSDGSTQAYRYAGFGQAISMFYSDHGNITSDTSITGPGTWDNAMNGTTGLWNESYASGWAVDPNLATFSPAGNWGYEAGGADRLFLVQVSVSFERSVASAADYDWAIRHNDNEAAPTSTVLDCRMHRTVSGTGYGVGAFNCVVPMDVDGTNNDDFEIVVQQTAAAAGDITIREMQVIIQDY